MAPETETEDFGQRQNHGREQSLILARLGGNGARNSRRPRPGIADKVNMNALPCITWRVRVLRRGSFY